MKDWVEVDLPARRPDLAGRILARLMSIHEKTKRSRHGQVVPVGSVGQVLTIKSMLETEMAGLRCDFLDLHLQFMKLFGHMQRDHTLHTTFSDIIQPSYIPNENELSLMVSYTLAFAACDRHILEEVFKRKLPKNIKDIVINAGAHVMREFILSGEAEKNNPISIFSPPLICTTSQTK